MFSYKGSLLGPGLLGRHWPWARADCWAQAVSGVPPVEALLEVEAGLGLGQLEVVLSLLPLAVPHPPELGQFTLQRHFLIVPGMYIIRIIYMIYNIYCIKPDTNVIILM